MLIEACFDFPFRLWSLAQVGSELFVAGLADSSCFIETLLNDPKIALRHIEFHSGTGFAFFCFLRSGFRCSFGGFDGARLTLLRIHGLGSG